MALKDDLTAEVKKIFREPWTKRTGTVVPEPESLKLGNDAVELLPATVLYADLTGSTNMVDTKTWEFSAEVYKTYLHCATKIIRSQGGSITSFDGDRVMGIFIGDHQSTPAAKAALKINYAVRDIINPALSAQYVNANFRVRQVVGIDHSNIRATRTGIRNNNDVVWVGQAANYAAKLTDLGSDTFQTWITEAVYNRLDQAAKFTDGRSMWERRSWSTFGNKIIYGSTWWWPV